MHLPVIWCVQVSWGSVHFSVDTCKLDLGCDSLKDPGDDIVMSMCMGGVRGDWMNRLLTHCERLCVLCSNSWL